jgi:hypothetical protein
MYLFQQIRREKVEKGGKRCKKMEKGGKWRKKMEKDGKRLHIGKTHMRRRLCKIARAAPDNTSNPLQPPG